MHAHIFGATCNTKNGPCVGPCLPFSDWPSWLPSIFSHVYVCIKICKYGLYYTRCLGIVSSPVVRTRKEIVN